MITLQLLSRMPAFTPVRDYLRQVLDARGAGYVRDLLDHGVWECWDKATVDWLLDAPDHETHEMRVKALYLVIEEWEQQGNGS